ncbi:hypothetical protein [Sporosarcina psychrophila]|uniref:hypothetical protein n=1 Tax=Sporosarcina psychrophila TaxID=1476 RepID=UPI00078C677A|nr:hypothetical protein [Sporosarcina psychrophila]AMQ07890.1 hypothetical protein AZE41_19190 [Sporosarcina psychrophila]
MRKRVLILAGIPWDTTIQRHHNFANLLNELDYEVFFVEKIPSSKFTVKKLVGRIRKKNRGKKDHLIVNRNNIRVINHFFLNPIRGIFWAINKYQVRKLVEKVGTDFEIVINYLPVNTTCNILENIKAKIIIYDCVRDFENWGGYPADVNVIEKKLVLSSSIILTDSYYLTDKIRNRYNEANVLQILPTVDEKQMSILKNSRLKNEINNILYFGAVGNHIDVHILNKLADDGYQVHIIGEIHQGIHLNNRIINHGFISDLELLAREIVNYADAIIIPYKGNMDGVIPAKLMQCIATGLPIFINKFYDSKMLNQYLYLYEDYKDLNRLIEQFDIERHKLFLKDMINFSRINSEECQYLKLKSVLDQFK